MIPKTVRVQAIRGFQQEQTIELSPSLTVIYGENGRGKTSLCEAWSWLFTGEMLVDLEPQSELGAAGKNIHTEELSRSIVLLDENGDELICRSEDEFKNIGGLPDSTSPVLLQYQLNQVLFSSLRDRRRFFERVMELDLEAEFAQKLRRACLNVDPFSHGAWEAWKRALDAIEQYGFSPPYPFPETSGQQAENELALIRHVAGYLGVSTDLEGLEQALETGGELELQDQLLVSPLTEDQRQVIEEALSALAGIEDEAEIALERAAWKERGLEFIRGPNCPFCNEQTIRDEKVEEIAAEVASIRKSHQAHLSAVSKFKSGISLVQPLAELNVEATKGHLQTLQSNLSELGIENFSKIAECIDQLDEALTTMQNEMPVTDIEDKETFQNFASTVMDLSKAWLELSPYRQEIEAALNERRARGRYVEAATSIVQYERANKAAFLKQLDARPVLNEIAEASPKVVDRLKDERLDALAQDIVKYYRILRPDDPTPLEEITSAGGVRGDIRIMAKSGDKVDHASALFSHSNSNALGMACHIARVLEAGHSTIILDDPFQSLDDSNREYAVRNLISALLDDGLQVVVLTHERDTAIKLLDIHLEASARGIALRWESEHGAIPEPMYPSGDAQLQIVLDGLEKDSPADVLKVANSLRQLVESFCADYLQAVGGGMPSTYRRNLGSYIDLLEKLSADVRPIQQTITNLNDWNEWLSDEAHFDGSGVEGLNKLRAIAREALQARTQEKQLRPPGLDEWKRVPKSEGIRQRSREILGS